MATLAMIPAVLSDCDRCHATHGKLRVFLAAVPADKVAKWPATAFPVRSPRDKLLFFLLLSLFLFFLFCPPRTPDQLISLGICMS